MSKVFYDITNVTTRDEFLQAIADNFATADFVTLNNGVDQRLKATNDVGDVFESYNLLFVDSFDEMRDMLENGVVILSMPEPNILQLLTKNS